MPFYAGWGLTIDKLIEPRRTRGLSLEELIAAAYILCPRYISPMTKLPCEVEMVIKELKELKDTLDNSLWLRFKLKFYRNVSRFIRRCLFLL